MRTVVEYVRAQDHTSFRQIANELNKRDIKAARGGLWHAATVRNVERRLQADKFTWHGGT